MSIKRALSKIKHPGGRSNSPLRSIGSFMHDKEYISSSDEFGSDGDLVSKNQRKRNSRQRQKEAKSRLSEEQRDTEARRKKERVDEEADETEDMKARYGDLPLVQSQYRTGETLTQFETVEDSMAGQEISFRARLHVIRRMGAKLVFLIFRQQVYTLQGVLSELPGVVSQRMIHYAEHIQTGSIVRVKGVLQEPKVPILGTTIHHVELLIQDIHVLVRREESAPFTVYEAELATAAEEQVEAKRHHISDRTRLANRILDLRTDSSQSIFRIQSAIGNLFRTALDSKGFIEIHTPKLQGTATESGASVFPVNYFARSAFLAQSPQLAKQMAIAADFEKVYEIGAVFRAENSNTHRHLTEYTGLDIEMAIEEHYHEALHTIDDTIKTIFKGLYERFRRELNVIKHYYPHEDLVWLEETPILTFSEGIQLLNDSGWTDDQGNPLSELEDLHTRDEIRLGELVKEKYHTDYYILDKFPASARPFYTMPDPEDPRFTNSFDIFVRGQEIISGGQRIHEPKMLVQSMESVGIEADTMKDYLEGFRLGAPPHAGAGIGLERLLMLILKIGNIRLASLFHRDPKSFPSKPPSLQLRHPEASTVHPPWGKKGTEEEVTETEYQPLEDLIANYGDATSTSWTDERFKIWRDRVTGAAVSFVPTGNFAIIPGDPLCDPSQYDRIVTQFLLWLKRETRYKPIWILCSPDIEDILGEKFGWRSLSCVAEDRVNPMTNRAAQDSEVARKIRRAQNEHVKIHSFPLGQPLPDETKAKIDERIQDWLSNRTGTQVHLSDINPWRDERHRRYFYATDSEGTICSFVVLAQLSPRNGMQVKYSLDFPQSPNGAIEYIVTHAIQSAAKSGVQSLTFGGGATAQMTPGHHMHGAKVKVLQNTYEAIVKQFKLDRKTEFRAKLGATEDLLYIAYPPRGLGSRGIKAILNFFED